jgi:small subunit ribosomal protein S4
VKLFLKGDRCFTKCPIDKEAVPPGQHGHARPAKPTEYGKRLREKQKARRFVGVLERQFRRMFARASHAEGNTGENLLRLMETRLDNVVRRMGFALSPKAARQLVFHGHVSVNGRRVDIPSYQAQPGDVIAVHPSLSKNLGLRHSLEVQLQKGLPSWLEWDGGLSDAVKKSAESQSLEGATLAGKIKNWPAREEMSFPVNEQFIVELYSK